jgi:mannose-6-phosphate isomerase-like protein (cupin superfamily)
MNCDFHLQSKDYGPKPYVADISNLSVQNQNFRTAIWTGCHMQMTLMSIPPCGDIGLEMHPDTDQLIRVEQGYAMVRMGACEKEQGFVRHAGKGDVVFIPAGTWHNIINNGNCPLKVSSVYAPPNHPAGTVQKTQKDAQNEEY